MSQLAAATDVTIFETEDAIVATTPALQLTIHQSPFAFAIARPEGTPVVTPPPGTEARLPSLVVPEHHGPGDELPYQPAARYLGLTYGANGMVLGAYNGTGRAPRWYAVTAVERWQQDGDTIRIEATSNDPVGRVVQLRVSFLSDAVVRLEMRLDRDVGITEMGISLAATPEEGFFGLGERFTRANHRGREVLNWIEDSPFDPRPGHDWTYWPVPFVLSSRGYGVLLDTTRTATFRLASERDDAWQASIEGAAMDAVFFLGSEPRDVVQQYTALTGRPPLPPVWTFGVWKTTLSGADSVRAEARRLRKVGLGVSALWIYDQLELETNSGWNSAMGYPEGEYPDMPELIRDLHAQSFRVLGYLNPQFITDRPRTDEGIAKGYFLKHRDGSTYIMPGPDPNPEKGIRFGQLALFDPTHPEGRAWWQEMLRSLLLDAGYDGWMHDFGEFTPRDAVFADGRTGEEIRNLYPTLYQQAGAEICRTVKPDFAFFVRSGYIGSNQWAPAAWPGDQHTDWSPDRGLPGIIAAGMSVGICGANAWGPDIGGFFDAYDGSDVASSKELWIRWCQFGALTPVMRDHLGSKRMTNPNTVDLWEDEETIDTWRRFARLHNALVPYLYAYARRAHETGIPTIQHTILCYPGDPESVRQEHQYLLGDELLVAPVIQPGATTRRVYLPAGTWFSYWDDTVYSGPGYQDVPAPLVQIPLLARSGAIVPTITEPVETLAGTTPDDLLADLTLRIYPSSTPEGSTISEFRLHDGTTIRLERTDRGIRLTLPAGTSDQRRLIWLRPGYDISSASADGQRLWLISPLSDQPGWWRDEMTGATMLRLPSGTLEVMVDHER